MSWQVLLCSSHPTATVAAAPVVAGVVGPRHKSYGIVCPACALLAVRHCAPALRTSLMAHLGHLGAWHGSEVAGGDGSAVQERGNSAEEERDTVKSSVTDRRPWNLGETRHNGFEGQISTFQRQLCHQHHRSDICGVSKLDNGSDLVWSVRVCGDG